MAISWAIEKCRFYLPGIDSFDIHTDHKLLVGIFAKDLRDIDNPRLLRFRERVMHYVFNVVWVPGKTHEMADALSWVGPCTAAAQEQDIPLDSPLCRKVATDPAVEELIEEALKDDEYKNLVTSLKNDESPLPNYKHVWHRLSLYSVGEDSIVALDSARIVVPRISRARILRLLHRGHQGIVKTKRAAAELYFWPNMNNDIEQSIQACKECQAMQASQSEEPMIGHENGYPMQYVSVDLFQTGGQDYLVMVDRATGFPFVKHMRKTSTDSVWRTLQKWFQVFGYPEAIRSDGAGQFRAQFNELCRNKSIRHELSSAYNPQSNGLAESAVKNMKRLVKKCAAGKEDFEEALLCWRNMPKASCPSPFQLMFGRRARTTLPTLPAAMCPFTDAARERMQQEKDTMSESLSHRNDGSTKLPPLQVGQAVLIQDPGTGEWRTRGVIGEIRDSGRSYFVELADGSTFLRNRRLLRPALDSDDGKTTESISASPVSVDAGLRRSPRLKKKRRVHFASPLVTTTWARSRTTVSPTPTTAKRRSSLRTGSGTLTSRSTYTSRCFSLWEEPSLLAQSSSACATSLRGATPGTGALGTRCRTLTSWGNRDLPTQQTVSEQPPGSLRTTARPTGFRGCSGSKGSLRPPLADQERPTTGRLQPGLTPCSGACRTSKRRGSEVEQYLTYAEVVRQRLKKDAGPVPLAHEEGRDVRN